MKNIRGLTVVELLITVIIISIILYISYITYKTLFTGFKQESEITFSETESLIGLELLRLDVEHIGFGIPSDETSKIIEWDETNKKLTIRSTLNNTNKSTKGYLLLKCNGGKLDIEVDGREDKSNNYLSVLRASNKEFFDKTDNLSSVSCTDGEIFIGFPVRDSVFSGSSNGCAVGLCEEIVYEFSTTMDLPKCNPNTRNLLRKLKNFSGEPILTCVADFKVRFDIDNDGNGKIDSGEENLETLPSTNNDIRQKLKKVNVYILKQIGQKDPEYEFTNTVNCSAASGKCVEIDGIKLKLPTGFENYRWKVIKLSVKPMSL